MYAKGLKTEKSIELWHKQIGHINLQRLRVMQSNGVVIGLPAFDSKRIDQVCEVLESGEAASAEEITQCSVVKEEPAYVRWKARYAEREKEREAQRVYLYYQECMQQLQMNNNNL